MPTIAPTDCCTRVDHLLQDIADLKAELEEREKLIRLLGVFVDQPSCTSLPLTHCELDCRKSVVTERCIPNNVSSAPANDEV